MTELTARQQELLDELLKDFKGDAREIFGEGGLLKTIGNSNSSPSSLWRLEEWSTSASYSASQRRMS